MQNMNILFLSVGDLPDLSVDSMYPDLLRCFREEGHEVYVICPSERRKGQPTRLSVEYEITVLRVKTYNITKSNWFEKGIAAQLIGGQYKKAIHKYLKGVKFDLLLYATPPITLVHLIQYLKKRDNAYSYLMLKDIFPQNAIDLGILPKQGLFSCITKYYRYLEKKLYRCSDKIGCMSKNNLLYLQKRHSYLEPERLEICPNTRDSIKGIRAGRMEVRKAFGLPLDRIIFICGGNFGKPQNVDFITTVLKANEGAKDRYFVFCGSGTDFNKLQEYEASLEEKHVTVLDSLDTEVYTALLSGCDIGLLFLDFRFTFSNFPSRSLDYMAVGMPIVAATNVKNDIGRLIKKEKLGWWRSSKEPEKIKELLDNICENPEKINDMRKRSHSYFSQHFDTKIAFEIIMTSYRAGKKL